MTAESRFSLLIADDDDAWRGTLESIFVESGFHTLSAATGPEALELLDRHRVHCMLFDFQMPGMTGLETLTIVRRRLVSIPCVMVTASARDEIEVQAVPLRIHSVLIKPVTRELVTGTVRRAIAAQGWS